MKTPAEIRAIVEKLHKLADGVSRPVTLVERAICSEAVDLIEELVKLEPRKELHLHYHPGKDQMLHAVGDVVKIGPNTTLPTDEQMAMLEKLSNG